MKDCLWVVFAPSDWATNVESEGQIRECEAPARFKVLSPEGLELWYCAEHYDAFMRGELDICDSYDSKPEEWRTKYGEPLTDQDFE